jgi:hypothetical protein
MQNKLIVADVVSMRDEALAWVSGLVGPREVCGYQLQGGGGGAAQGWRAVGFFSEVFNASRVVFEALYIPDDSRCILRVYRESPVAFLFTAVIEERATDAHLAAAQVFGDAISNGKLRDVVSAEWRTRRALSPGLEDALGSVLYPIPPPVE